MALISSFMLSRRDPFSFSNLICDLDGTLVDSLAGIEGSINHALHACLPGRVVSGIREQIGPPIPTMLGRLLPDLDAEELETLVAAFREHYDRTGYRASQIYPEVSETLATLGKAGMAMFVLTNKPILATRAILAHTGILAYFADVLSAPDAFVSKREAARALQDQYDLEPSETALVGDGLDDASAAGGCGFAFILAGYGYGNATHENATDCIATLKTFGEILSIPSKHYPL
jgi:phosphoglycolate phosphatase